VLEVEIGIKKKIAAYGVAAVLGAFATHLEALISV